MNTETDTIVISDRDKKLIEWLSKEYSVKGATELILEATITETNHLIQIEYYNGIVDVVEEVNGEYVQLY